MAKSKTKLPFTGWEAFKMPEDDEELEQVLAAQRDAYMSAIDTMMDKTAEAYDNPSLAQFPVQDMALFTLFLAAVKMVEFSGQSMSAKAILGAVHFLIKRAEHELPELARQVNSVANNNEVGNA